MLAYTDEPKKQVEIELIIDIFNHNDTKGQEHA